jgi:hypothetical protein
LGVAAFPPGNAAPEEPYVRAFPAYGSSTALSTLLMPVLSTCTSPSHASHRRFFPLTGKRALNRYFPATHKLPRIESQIRACDSCTTRKSAPFQVGANLEPLYRPLQATVRFLRILIPACLTASLAGRLPYTAHEQRGPWRTVGLTVFPVEDRSGLGSAYSPAVALSVCPEYQAGHPTACLLAQA